MVGQSELARIQSQAYSLEGLVTDLQAYVEEVTKLRGQGHGVRVLLLIDLVGQLSRAEEERETAAVLRRHGLA